MEYQKVIRVNLHYTWVLDMKCTVCYEFVYKREFERTENRILKMHTPNSIQYDYINQDNQFIIYMLPFV